MKIFILSSMTVSLIYMSSSHPVLLTMLILVQSTMVCITAWVALKISWFSYILFLIFLGGLMVLFMYITSLASNEMILTGIQMYKTFIYAGAISLMLIFPILNSQQLTETPSFMCKTFYFMYSWNSMIIIMLTMLYLLLTLIIVVKISNKFEAPLKNLIFY